MFKIAIVGKANVGKTTIFNKIIGKKIAITNNQPGVTIDRKSKTTTWKSMTFELCDTAGIENCSANDEIKSKAQKQSLAAIEEADLCIFTIDGREYADNIDMFLAKLIHKANKKAILLVNKLENIEQIIADNTVMRFKWDSEPIYFSAEHNIGFEELRQAIKPFYQRYIEIMQQNFDPEHSEELQSEAPKRINIAIVGKPNAGKSTLINNFLKTERIVTSSVAGTTRDSIAIPFEYKGRKINLVDTAGIRKQIYIEDKIESESVKESFRAIDFAHVVIFLTDAGNAEEIPDSQDKKILAKASKEGKVIILAANKWDLVDNAQERVAIIQNEIQSLGKISIYNNSFVAMSAKNESKLDSLLDIALESYDKWAGRISTNKLNNWLHDEFMVIKKPPRINGKEVKFKFITQTSASPPTFKVFCNFVDVPEQYVQFLHKSLSEKFDLKGVPLRTMFKKSENPFSGKSVKRTKRF